MEMKKPLPEGINEVVMDYLQDRMASGETIDVAEMAHEMAQSLVDMIVEQEKDHQAPLLASMIVSLGDEYLRRCGLTDPFRQQH